MDKFLRSHKLPKLTQEERNNLNSLMSIKEIEFIIQNLTKTCWLDQIKVHQTSIKDQISNIFGTGGGHSVPVTTTELCYSREKAARDDNKWAWLCSNKNVFTKIGGRQT